MPPPPFGKSLHFGIFLWALPLQWYAIQANVVEQSTVQSRVFCWIGLQWSSLMKPNHCLRQTDQWLTSTVLYCTVLYCTLYWPAHLTLLGHQPTSGSVLSTLHYTVLFCTVLYCTVLYCMLYYTVLFCTVLHCTVLFCNVYCIMYCSVRTELKLQDIPYLIQLQSIEWIDLRWPLEFVELQVLIWNQVWFL